MEKKNAVHRAFILVVEKKRQAKADVTNSRPKLMLQSFHSCKELVSYAYIN